LLVKCKAGGEKVGDGDEGVPFFGRDRFGGVASDDEAAKFFALVDDGDLEAGSGERRACCAGKGSGAVEDGADRAVEAGRPAAGTGVEQVGDCSGDDLDEAVGVGVCDGVCDGVDGGELVPSRGGPGSGFDLAGDDGRDDEGDEAEDEGGLNVVGGVDGERVVGAGVEDVEGECSGDGG
jgi:hypothetical protein